MLTKFKKTILYMKDYAFIYYVSSIATGTGVIALGV